MAIRFVTAITSVIDSTLDKTSSVTIARKTELQYGAIQMCGAQSQ